MPNTMDRPFPVYFETAGRQNVLEVMIEFQAQLDDGSRLGVTEVMNTFVRLGATGGLAGEGYDPGRSCITLEVSQLKLQGGHWVFEDVRIDPASVFILLNMIHYVHLEEVPVNMVRIVWPAINELLDPMAIQFPEQWSQPSYILEIGDLLDDINLTVDFSDPQDDSVIQQVVEAMSVWLLATHRGAYADDAFDPSKSAVYLGPDVMDVSPDRIVWFIEIMRCNESALDGLLNLLEWVHQKIARISLVEMEP